MLLKLLTEGWERKNIGGKECLSKGGGHVPSLCTLGSSIFGRWLSQLRLILFVRVINQGINCFGLKAPLAEQCEFCAANAEIQGANFYWPTRQGSFVGISSQSIHAKEKETEVQEGSDFLPQLELWSIISGLKFSTLYSSGLPWTSRAKDLCWESKIENQWESLIGTLYCVLAKSAGVCNSPVCCLSTRWAFGCKRDDPHDFYGFVWLRFILWAKRTLPGPAGVHTQTQRPKGEKPKLCVVRIRGSREWLL